MAKSKKTKPGRNVVPFRPKGGGLPPTGVANPWSARIIAAFDRTREGFFEIGRLLNQAKANLPHGQFISVNKADYRLGSATQTC